MAPNEAERNPKRKGNMRRGDPRDFFEIAEQPRSQKIVKITSYVAKKPNAK